MDEKKVIVIADAHLGSQDNDVDTMIRFIDSLDPDKNEVVFLGDVFHIWAAPRRYQSKSVKIFLRRLTQFTQKGGRSHLVLGNRDLFFPELVENHKRLHLPFSTISKEFFEMEFTGKTFLFHHGDTVNTLDQQYLKWRSIVRSLWFRCLIALLPSGKVKKLMKKAELSFKKTNKKFRVDFPEQEWEIFLEEVAEMYQPDYLLIGHFHPKVPIKNVCKGTQGVVISDWMKDRSYLEIDAKLNLNMLRYE